MANVFENVVGGLWHGVEHGIQGLNGGVQHVGRNLGNSLGSVWNDSLGSKGLFGKFDNWYGGSGGEAATKLGLGAIAGFGIGGAAAGGELGAGAGEGAGGSAMPAAVPETSSTLSQWGMTETAPGVWEQTEGYTPPPTSSGNRYQTSSSQQRSSGQQSYEPEQQDYLGHGLNPYTRHAIDASSALGNSGPNYWMSRADQLRLLAQHVADQLYGVRS